METIATFLKQRDQRGLLRFLRPAQERPPGRMIREDVSYIDFSSNDYLGLSRHPHLCATAVKALQQHGSAGGASRLLSGDLELHHTLEERSAALKGKDAALVYNSGYQANLGIISALCSRGDAVICDRLCHASILDGVALSGARLFRFQHNNPDHLQTLLDKTKDRYQRRLVVTESIFSMDGDRAPLREITTLTQEKQVLLMVDEAHATGVLGPGGSGLVADLKLTDRIDLIMGTYSKALAGFGGYVACSQDIKQFLINKARSFIYSTALPPAVIASNLAALDLLEDEPERRHMLQQRADWLRDQMQKKGFVVRGQSQIIPWIVGDTARASALSQALETKGFVVMPIRPPTVPAGQSRLRFSLSYAHSQTDLEQLLAALDEVRDV